LLAIHVNNHRYTIIGSCNVVPLVVGDARSHTEADSVTKVDSKVVGRSNANAEASKCSRGGRSAQLCKRARRCSSSRLHPQAQGTGTVGGGHTRLVRNGQGCAGGQDSGRVCRTQTICNIGDGGCAFGKSNNALSLCTCPVCCNVGSDASRGVAAGLASFDSCDCCGASDTLGCAAITVVICAAWGTRSASCAAVKARRACRTRGGRRRAGGACRAVGARGCSSS